jgi:hypothetical protein
VVVAGRVDGGVSPVREFHLGDKTPRILVGSGFRGRIDVARSSGFIEVVR